MKTNLSPKDLAAAVGVSESSLKRWADDGRIRVNRTAGGHRRIPLQEAIRFTREARLPVLRPDILGLPSLNTQTATKHRKDPAQTFHTKLAEGDVITAQAILIDLYLSGQSVASICDGPIRTAMTIIGEAWNHGHEGIFVEHRATDICLQALSVLRSLINSPTNDDADNPETVSRPMALGCAPSGDPYLIPSLMCAAVLADTGYRTINIGPDTPFGVLGKAIEAHRPRLVWLACAADRSVPDVGDILDLSRELANHNIALAVGGRVIEKITLPAGSNLIHCQTMNELDKFARGLLA